MAQPIDEQIRRTWRALSSDNSKEGWGMIPIYKQNKWLLSAGYNISTYEEAIFLEIRDSCVSFSDNILPVAQGFRVQKLRKDGSNQGLALIRQTDSDLGLFTKIAADVCNTVIQHDNLSENQLIVLFINRINAWLSFMRKGSEILSSEAELGLIGELETLSALMTANIPINYILDAWKGPLDGIKDFELGEGAIETKSTLANSGFIVKIGSLEQLDDSYKSPLFLNGHRFSINATGTTLVERIKLLRERLANFPSELSKLNNLLLSVGYLENLENSYIRKFKTENTYFWLVDESFPRLVPTYIAKDIRKVKYEIDLTSFITKSIYLHEVIEKLGIKNCGTN